jgi:hypothetical protein
VQEGILCQMPVHGDRRTWLEDLGDLEYDLSFRTKRCESLAHLERMEWGLRFEEQPSKDQSSGCHLCFLTSISFRPLLIVACPVVRVHRHS